MFNFDKTYKYWTDKVRINCRWKSEKGGTTDELLFLSVSEEGLGLWLWHSTWTFSLALREHLRAHKAALYLSHSVLLFIDLYMNFTVYKWLILYKRKLNRHKTRIMEILRNKLILRLSIPTQGFPRFLLYLRKLGATFARRCFRGANPHRSFLNITVICMCSRLSALLLCGLEIYGPRQANLVLIAYASSEGSGEPAHPRSLARTFTARSYKQCVKRNL